MSRLHRQVMRVLLADMVAGEIPEGSKLPKEVDLTEQFGVSRGVIRESLRSLEERGVIAVRHGSGAIVQPSQRWDVLDGDVLAAMLETPGTANVLGEFVEARRMLEVQAAALAAERASDEDVDALTQAFAQMRAAAERRHTTSATEELYHQADLDFHAALLEAAKNRVLSRMIRPIRAALVEARRALAHPEYRAQRAIPEHERILTAVVAHDPEAAREAMGAHLATVEQYLQEFTADAARNAPTR
jgi:GntR family transcriptional repressor for pyruvate dehydrogenase complex